MGTITLTDETAQKLMEEALWQFIDIAGMCPSVIPDDRIWAHVLAYMPPHVILPKFVTNERET